jgi:hypothetical protein
MYTLGAFLLLFVRFGISAFVMFFAFKYGPWIGTAALGGWLLLEGTFSTERSVRFIQEGRPDAGVDREVYDKYMGLADRTAGSIFSEQFFVWASLLVIYCVIGWNLDISPVYVLLGCLGSNLITWPYSISRIRQVVSEMKEKNTEKNKLKSISEQILDSVMDEYESVPKITVTMDKRHGE